MQDIYEQPTQCDPLIALFHEKSVRTRNNLKYFQERNNIYGSFSERFIFFHGSINHQMYNLDFTSYNLFCSSINCAIYESFIRKMLFHCFHFAQKLYTQVQESFSDIKTLCLQSLDIHCVFI